MAMTYVIQHDRPKCIGCAACAAVAPESWEMTADDGKSDLIGSKRTANSGEIKLEELELEELRGNRDAAEACPVNVIHIIRKDGGEKIRII